MSMNGALVRHTYPDAHLGRGIGLNGLVVALSAAVAPSLASGILAVGPWPWLFAVNVPFGLMNLCDRPVPAGVGAVLPAVRLDERAAQRRDVRPVLRRLRRADPRRRRAAGGRGLLVAVLAGAFLVRRGARMAAPLIRSTSSAARSSRCR